MPLKDNISIKDFPVLTALLIAINVLMFVGWEGGSNVDVKKVVLYGTIPYEITHPGTQCVPVRTGAFSCEPEKEMQARYGVDFPQTWKTPFVSMFMHISWAHLIGNMLFLFVFGVALEAGLGRRSFLLFYVVGGLAADLGHTLFDPSSPLPSLGASGAISAVMGGYVMLYPRAKIFTWLFPPIPLLLWIRAAWVIGVLMFLQALEAYIMLSSAFGSGGGVAYFAHFGGFIAGVLLVLAVLDRESIENFRRQARIASGDEQPIDSPIAAVPMQPPVAAAQAQWAATQQAAHAQQQAYAQQAYDGQAVAAAGGQPGITPAAYPPPDSFARRASVLPRAVPSNPFAPQAPAPQQAPARQQAPAAQPLAPPQVQPATPVVRNPRPRPAPGTVPRPPGC